MSLMKLTPQTWQKYHVEKKMKFHIFLSASSDKCKFRQTYPGIRSNIFLCYFMSLISLYVMRVSKIKQCLPLDDPQIGAYPFSSPNLHLSISVALIKTQKHPAQAASGIHFDKIQRNKSCGHKLYGLSPVTNTSHLTPPHSLFLPFL